MLSSHFQNNYHDITPFLPFTADLGIIEQQQINKTYEIYANHLQQRELALRYLHKTRGLSENIISRFQLGFADKSICEQFRDIDNPVAFRGMLQRTGVIGPKGHMIFLGSVIIPVKRNCNVVGGVGRRVSDVVRLTSTPYPFHLIDDEALFNADCLAEQPSCVVLCKSPMEALSALGQGIDEVISLVGNVDFSDAHAKLLKSHKVKLVKVAFNQSPYYLQKLSAIEQVLKQHRIRCKVVDLEDWQDINALRLYDPSGKSLRQRVRQAQPYGGH
jgi:hypothetical protein